MDKQKFRRQVDVSNINLNELNKLAQKFSGQMRNEALESRGKGVTFSYEVGEMPTSDFVKAQLSERGFDIFEVN